MPANTTDIKVYTAAAKANYGDFEERVPSDLVPTMNGRTVEVKGFDYNANFVTKNPRGENDYGKKLIVEFTIKPREGFFGGNGVPTNTTDSGIINDGSMLEQFPVPVVDVPVLPIEFSVPDTYVYLNGSVKKEYLRNQLNVKVGDMTLDMTKGAEGYWGMEPWQVEFVKISTRNQIDDFLNIKEDKTVTIYLDIAPTETGDASSHSASATAKINVLKPYYVCKDSELNAGSVPDYMKENFVAHYWMHGDKVHTEVTNQIVDSRGTNPPVLKLSFTPEAAPVFKDTPVRVTVKMDMPDNILEDVTDFTEFHHMPCDFHGCNWEDVKNDGYHFIVHVNTFNLVISKNAPNGVNDPNDVFVFTVSNNTTQQKLTVSLKAGKSVTIKDRPAGTYTVTEDTIWSSGYTADHGSVTVTPDSIRNGTAMAAFTNTRKDVPLSGRAEADNYWGTTVPVK